MVALANVALLLVPTPARGPADEVDARLDREGGQAGLGEGEVAGAVERPAHAGPGDDGERFRAGRRLEEGPERRAVEPQRVDVASRAAYVRDIDVQDGRGLIERHEWGRDVRPAAEQAALFGRGRDEQHAAARSGFELLQCLGGAEQGRDAGRAVFGAAADPRS